MADVPSGAHELLPALCLAIILAGLRRPCDARDNAKFSHMEENALTLVLSLPPLSVLLEKQTTYTLSLIHAFFRL